MRRDEGSFCTKEAVFEVYGLKDDFFTKDIPPIVKGVNFDESTAKYGVAKAVITCGKARFEYWTRYFDKNPKATPWVKNEVDDLLRFVCGVHNGVEYVIIERATDLCKQPVVMAYSFFTAAYFGYPFDDEMALLITALHAGESSDLLIDDTPDLTSAE